jgi:hypothetical protein
VTGTSKGVAERTTVAIKVSGTAPALAGIPIKPRGSIPIR